MVDSRHTMEKEPACPSLNRLAALMQGVYRVRELIVADPLARVALVSVQTDLLRVQKLIKRHRATCAHCKLNQPLRENPSHKPLPSPKVVPIKRVSCKPLFTKHSETCTHCRFRIPVSQVKRVDREYSLCPHCGRIYYREVA